MPYACCLSLGVHTDYECISSFPPPNIFPPFRPAGFISARLSLLKGPLLSLSLSLVRLCLRCTSFSASLPPSLHLQRLFRQGRKSTQPRGKRDSALINEGALLPREKKKSGIVGMEGASLPHFVFLPCRRTYSCSSIRWLPLCHHRGGRSGDAPFAFATDRRRKEEEEVATQMGVAVGASVGGGVRWMGDTLGPRQRLSLALTHTLPHRSLLRSRELVCGTTGMCVRKRETASKRHFRSVPS